MIGAFRVPAMPRGISTPKDVGSLGTHGIADFGTLQRSPSIGVGNGFSVTLRFSAPKQLS
jgi:hypothetical protein